MTTAGSGSDTGTDYLATIPDQEKRLIANAEALMHRLEDHRRWLESTSDLEQYSRVLDQMEPLITDANALHSAIRSFMSRSTRLFRSMEDLRKPVDPQLESYQSAIDLDRTVDTVDAQNVLGRLEHMATELSSRWYKLEDGFKEFRTTLQRTIFEVSIEEHGEGTLDGYCGVVAEKMRLNSDALRYVLEGRGVRNRRDRSVNRDLTPTDPPEVGEPWMKHILASRFGALLHNYCFVTDQDIRETSKRLSLQPSTVRMRLSNFRVDVSETYLKKFYIPKKLDELINSDLGWNIRYQLDDIRSSGRFIVWTDAQAHETKILLKYFVLPVVDEQRATRAMASNVQRTLLDVKRHMSPAPIGRGADGLLYHGAAVVLMSTGSEPFLLTYQQIESIVEGYSKHVWANPKQDILELAKKDPTLRPFTDFKSLLDSAIYPDEEDEPEHVRAVLLD